MTAVLFLIPPGPALASYEPGHQEMEIGRTYGWMQATCSYAQVGWLEPMQAERALSVYLDRFKKEYGADSAIRMTAILLNKFPKCRQYWPIVD